MADKNDRFGKKQTTLFMSLCAVLLCAASSGSTIVMGNVPLFISLVVLCSSCSSVLYYYLVRQWYLMSTFYMQEPTVSVYIQAIPIVIGGFLGKIFGLRETTLER